MLLCVRSNQLNVFCLYCIVIHEIGYGLGIGCHLLHELFNLFCLIALNYFFYYYFINSEIGNHRYIKLELINFPVKHEKMLHFISIILILTTDTFV